MARGWLSRETTGLPRGASCWLLLKILLPPTHPARRQRRAAARRCLRAGRTIRSTIARSQHESFHKRAEREQQNLLQESVQLAQQLHANGQYLDAAPLHPSSETTCIRVREGERIVTDGPFAETREQLGGYFLIKAKDLNEAIGIAAQIPGARIGTVEIRPVTEVAGLPKG